MFPENTLLAFRKALSLGAAGIELDIQMSRDRVPVVIHDESVDRTTNGHGLVSSLTFRELKQLDAGVKFSNAYRGERIPSLRESLLAIKEKGKVYLELKQSVTPPDLICILNEIELCDMEKWVTLISFDFSQLEISRQLSSSITLGKLLLPNDFNLSRMIKANISLACAPYTAFLELPELLPILKINGLISNANGITNRRTAKYLMQKGIHILGCDKPL
jgi:Glycerophosphoryl diester phosphodiesterase